MWTAFEKGRLDCTRVPDGEAQEVSADPRVSSGEWSAGAWPALAVSFVGLNLTDVQLGQSPELRSALASSTNAASVIRDAGGGVPTAAAGFVPSSVPGAPTGLSGIAYDPAKALELIQGLNASPRLSYWYAAGTDGDEIADILVSGWQAGGIEVRPQTFEWATFYDKLGRAASGSGAQLFSVGYIADYPSLDDFLYVLFHSDMSRTGSFTCYSNPDVDSLLEQARATIDREKRAGLYAQAQERILADLPAIPVYFYRSFRVTDARVAGYVQDPLGMTDMWALWLR